MTILETSVVSDATDTTSALRPRRCSAIVPLSLATRRPFGEGRKGQSAFTMTTEMFIVLFVVGIFGVDIGRRTWRQTEWKRRMRCPPDEE